MEDGNFFLFPFFFNCDESFVGLLVDFDGFVDGEVFFLDLFFKVVPLGSDAFVELLCLFEDGELKHVEGFAVLDNQLKVRVDFFGVGILALLEFVHDGVEVHGVFDFIVITGDKCAIDGFLENL